MRQSIERQNWNAEYETQRRYEGELPIPFVDRIIEELGEAGKQQIGLYVGCGNGRNYIPLVESGLTLHGIDISDVAIEQLEQRLPEARGKVFAADFSKISSARVFDYLIAIQVFQHGDKKAIDNLFNRAQIALKPASGRFFLRVNSVSTEIYEQHHILEGDDQFGKTIFYESGPKKGQQIHFFTSDELEEIARKNDFDIVLPTYEVAEQRKLPQTGTWAQWETIWRKR